MKLTFEIEVPEHGEFVGMDYCHDGQWRVYFRGVNRSFFAAKAPTVEEAARLAGAKLSAWAVKADRSEFWPRDLVGRQVRTRVKRVIPIEEDELFAAIGAALKGRPTIP